MKITDDDSKLLVALVGGDFKAFGELYEKYHRPLYFFALKLSKNTHEAEELVQSVFVTVWETRRNVVPAKSFSAYLFRIARNRFYDMLRRRITENCYADFIMQQNDMIITDLEKQMEDKELNAIINKLLEELPKRRHDIFMMSREENMTYKQIAEKLQISENTVDSQIRNVLNFLRKELAKYLQ